MPHFLQVTGVPGIAASVAGVNDVGGGARVGSGAKTPMNAVVIPTTKNTPPMTTYARSVTHAKMCPVRIVPRHEESANVVRIGPAMTKIIPMKKISLLNHSYVQCEPMNAGRTELSNSV